MKFLFIRLLSVLTTTLIWLADADADADDQQLQNGDQVCTEGYIMDNYCLMRSRMLDNGLDPLRFPEEHTVHCLVDVDICRSSGFVVLIDPAPGQEVYTVGYALDGDGTNWLTRLAREVGATGSCSTCLGTGSLVKGMRAGIMGTVVNAEMVPPLIRVNSAEYVSPDVSFCATAQFAIIDPTTRTTLAPSTVATTETSPVLVPTSGPTDSPTLGPPTIPPTHSMNPTNANVQTTNIPTLAPTTESTILNVTESDAPSTGPTNDPTATPTVLAVSDVPSAGPTTVPLLQEGSEVCHVGYIMDNFCLDLGFLLDDNDVVTLEEPFLHSIHCLVDVPMCVQSNYTILSEPAEGETLYSVAFQFDAVGTQRLAEMARRVGEMGYCTTCTGGDGGWLYGFRVGVKGIVIDANVTPPLIEIIEAAYSSDGSLDYCHPDYIPPPPPGDEEEETATSEPTASFPENSISEPTPVPVAEDDTIRETPKTVTEAPAMGPTIISASQGKVVVAPIRLATLLSAIGLLIVLF